MTLLGQLKSNKGDNLGGCSDQVFWWSRASVESVYSCRGQSGTGRNPVSPASPAAHGPGQRTHGCQTQVLTVFTVRGDPESVEECPLGIHFRGWNCEECVCSLNGARGVSAGSPCGAGPVRSGGSAGAFGSSRTVLTSCWTTSLSEVLFLSSILVMCDKYVNILF